MKRTRIIVCTLALLVLAGAARAQDVSATGKVMVGAHEIEMKEGKFYVIRVEGKGFSPQVVMTPNILPFGPTDFNKPNVFNSYYLAKKDEKNTILVAPNLFGLRGTGPFEYQIDVTALQLAAKPILDEKGELTADDPPFKDDFIARPHHKAYNLKVKANQYYIIDMKEPERGNLDSYLYLLNPNGKVVQRDDDGGGFPSARIVYRAPADGDYRIIATGLGNAQGRFVLTVRSAEK